MEFVTSAGANTTSDALKGIFHKAKRHIRYVIHYKKYVEKFEEKHKTLMAKSTTVQEVVDAAERNGEKIRPDVLDWCRRVDKVIPEEKNRVEALEVKAKNKCFFGLCLNFKSRYQLSSIAKEDVEDFDKLINERLPDTVGYRDVPEAMVHKDFESFKSREKVFNDIVEALKDSTTSMIGVYGMPGVGKTFLVKEVDKQVQEAKLFDSVVMVVVSQTPDIDKIQDQIAESLVLKFEEKSTVVRARRLCARLKKEKNVLVVLDDLWKKLDLEEVGIPFGNQHKGCKVLLTSRDQNVLRNQMDATKTFQIVDLEDDEEAWEFFKKMVGDRAESPELRPIATEVAKKCARLPLAIATVAKALRYQSLVVWKDALLQLQKPSPEINSSEITGGVYKAIALSINFLSSEDLKQTLLLCSLLRRDNVEYLLRYAIGLSLIKGVNTLNEARDRLLSMMINLKSSCLLRHSNSSNEESFDVHDLVCFVAKSIAYKENQVFTLEEKDVLTDWPDRELMKRCKKIWLRYPSINKLPDELHCPQLFLFYLNSKDLSLTVPDNYFKEATNLKVLDLTYMQLSPLPSSICLLTSLSTLCLDSCKLGDNVTILGRLNNLEILSLADSDIRILAEEIGQLVKLKLLDVTDCTKLKTISAGVLSSLSRLEELYMGGTSIQWGQSGASLAEVNTLSRLSTLEIQIPDANAAPQDFFQKLQNLERYKIFIEKEWDVFGNYECARTLKLRLTTNIDDLDHGIKKLLKKTEDLYLDELKGVKIALQELTDEESLLHLKNLHIQNGLGIEYVIDDKNEFPQLKSLTLQGLPRLISFFPLHKTGAVSLPLHEFPLFSEKILFPCLEHLKLSSINVSRIWDNQLSNTYLHTHEKLTTLKIKGCRNLKHLLSFSMAKCLVHLTYFKIIGCNSLREIISTDDTEEETRATMSSLSLFPQLKSLELRGLDQLIGFCSNSKARAIEFPSIMSLTIDNCPKLEGFICRSTVEGNQPISSQVLFDDKVAFPSLDEVKVSYLRKIKMIWKNPLPPNSFSKLHQLVVVGCEELLTIFPSNMLTTFQGLRILSVRNCVSLEQVFEVESSKMHEQKEAVVVTAQLREFYIWELPKLEYIWKSDPKGIFAFKYLCIIRVRGCRSLKNVFPASVARGLPQLDHLEIMDCGVEEIVSRLEEGSDSVTTVTFEFDQLSFLTLFRLTELKCFYPGKHTIKWPMLKNLEAVQCGKMKLFGTQLRTNNGQLDSRIQPPLFLVEKVIPKLEYLALDSDYIALISDGQFPSSLFNEIKAFRVQGNRAKSATNFQISLLQRFCKVETLGVHDCEIKELFCTEGDTSNTKAYAARPLSTIKIMELFDVNNLKYCLWKQDVRVDHILPNLEMLKVDKCVNLISLGSSSALFQNLTTLNVQRCDGMKYLDTCLAVKGLAQLKELLITDCSSMKEIVVSGDEVTCHIIFSRLESLKLVNLPRLKSFCSGNHTFGFPRLEELIVANCAELEIFCEGVLDENVPLLLRVEDESGKRHWRNGLNSTVQYLHSTKGTKLPNTNVVLSEFSKEKIERKLMLPKLVRVRVESCSKLSSSRM